MQYYKRLTEKDSCYYNEMDYIDVDEMYYRLAELEDKIENGTLVEIGEVAKLFNRIWECPCDFVLDNEDVCDIIREKVEEDWCDKNCDTEDFSKCWEVYLKPKLKELQEQDK